MDLCGYEARMEALGDIIRNRAYNLLMDGEFDEEIQKLILEGKFDDTVIKRIEQLDFKRRNE